MLDTILYLQPYIIILLTCIVLKYSCDLFEQSAGYLGRNMPAGVKGATVNAVGSSMPEMASAFAVLFFMPDPVAAFGIALGITAGSGVFNCAVIPSLAILFAKDSNGNTVNKIELDRKALMRDGFFVVLSDIALISMIAYGTITNWMAILLIAIYVAYSFKLLIDAKRSGDNDVEEYEDEQLDDRGVIGNILTFNFNKLLFGGRVLNGRSAITLLAIAILIITGASHYLVIGVDTLAGPEYLGIPAFISGLIFGAAASSIPDLILSLKDARKGEYEDAVANPLASNTFDTSISIGLPLIVWFLVTGNDAMEIMGTEDNMLALRISVVGMSAAVCATLIAKYKGVTKKTALVMLGFYGIWCAWIVHTFFGA